MPLTDKLTIEKKPMKTAAALRASDTAFLHKDSMPKLIEEITKPKTEAYDAGFDAGLNGANMSNCSFRFFTTIKSRDEWQEGNDKGRKERIEKGTK